MVFFWWSSQPNGYESTTFYDIDHLITLADWGAVFSHDALIVLSHETIATGGLTDSQIATLDSFDSYFEEAVNENGMDVWVGSPGSSTAMYDFLPTGVVSTAILPFSTDTYVPTTEGAIFGLTTVMTNRTDSPIEFTSFDSDFFQFETRGTSDVVSLAAQSVGILNDQLTDLSSFVSSTLPTLQGNAFLDLNQNGEQDGTNVD